MNKNLKPWLAALLSLFLPGLGHFYCGKTRTSIAIYLCFLLFCNFGFAMMVFCDFKPFNIIIPILLILTFYILVIVLSYGIAKQIQAVSISKQHIIFHRWFFYIILIIFFGYASSVAVPIWSSYQNFKMPAASMEDTLLVGDNFLVDMYAYYVDQPIPNDLVVFVWPIDRKTLYIKRCVATEGQTVEVKNKELFVDNKRFKDPEYIKYNSIHQGDVRDNYGPYLVPPDHYFMMGDNRDNSSDSRYWGPVHQDLIVGKLIRICLSSDLSRIGMKIE